MHYLTLDYVKLENHLKKLGYNLTIKFEKLNDITITDIIHFINPAVNALDSKEKNPEYEKSTLNILNFVQPDKNYFKEPSVEELFEQGFIPEEENKVEINIDYLIDQLTSKNIGQLITPRYIDEDIKVDYNFDDYEYDYEYEITTNNLIKVPMIHHNVINVIEQINEIFEDDLNDQDIDDEDEENDDFFEVPTSYEEHYGTPSYLKISKIAW